MELNGNANEIRWEGDDMIKRCYSLAIDYQ